MSPERILNAIRLGRPDTAMKGFAGILEESEVQAVAAFVEKALIGCGSPNTRYHTVENGWPEHEARNAPAFPFVNGTVPVDVAPDSLLPDQRNGLHIFMQSCVICHEGRSDKPDAPSAIRPVGDLDAVVREVSAGDDEPVRTTPPLAPSYHEYDEHDDNEEHEYERGYGAYEQRNEHDRPPVLSDPTPIEARGEWLYREGCAQCHAADGRGANWIGRFLQPHPPDLTDPATIIRLNDVRLKQVILDGLADTSMPAFRSVLSPGDADAIAAYMKRAFFGSD